MQFLCRQVLLSITMKKNKVVMPAVFGQIMIRGIITIHPFKTPDEMSVWCQCMIMAYWEAQLQGFCLWKKPPRPVNMHGALSVYSCTLGLALNNPPHYLFIASAIVGRYFRKRRKVAEMLTLGGSGVGMAVMTVSQRHLQRSVPTHEWPWATRHEAWLERIWQEATVMYSD